MKFNDFKFKKALGSLRQGGANRTGVEVSFLIRVATFIPLWLIYEDRLLFSCGCGRLSQLSLRSDRMFLVNGKLALGLLLIPLDSCLASDN